MRVGGPESTSSYCSGCGGLIFANEDRFDSRGLTGRASHLNGLTFHSPNCAAQKVEREIRARKDPAVRDSLKRVLQDLRGTG